MITLNEGQQAAHDQLVAYLMGKDKSKRMWLLKGYAGTGKTTTVGCIINTVNDLSKGLPSFARPSIAVSAPTHKAVHVLKKMNSLNAEVDYATIHSLLGLKEVINPITGKQEFKQAFGENGPRIEAYTILFLDETSMLQDELFLLLDPYVSQGLRIVMMGDPVQIPPVNETDPIPFKPGLWEKYGIGVMELTEIVRQAADNPILSYATDLRKVYKTGNPVPVTMLNKETGTGIEVIDVGTGEYRVKDLLDYLFKDPRFEADPDFMKVIAWTNATVDHYNKHIRALIYGTLDLPIVMKGEKMICDSPVLDPLRGIVLLHTNQEVEVINFEIAEKTLLFPQPFVFGQEADDMQVKIKFYNTEVEYDSYNVFTKEWIKKRTFIEIMHEDSLPQFRELQNSHKKICIAAKDPRIRGKLWNQYYNNEKKFAWMKYNYAITAHKSQGSTYDNVMMLDWDMQKNRRIEERNRIKYVAATRSRHMLYIVN
jgi:hypothetical protein